MWQVNYGGHTFKETDLTIGQCEELEELIGLSWLAINPVRSAKQARIVTALLVADATGRAFDEVSTEIKSLKALEFLTEHYENKQTLVEEVPDDQPTMWDNGFPPRAAEPSTSTS